MLGTSEEIYLLNGKELLDNNYRFLSRSTKKTELCLRHVDIKNGRWSRMITFPRFRLFRCSKEKLAYALATLKYAEKRSRARRHYIAIPDMDRKILKRGTMKGTLSPPARKSRKQDDQKTLQAKKNVTPTSCSRREARSTRSRTLEAPNA